MKMKQFLIIWILMCSLDLVSSSRILFLIPYGSPSHAIFYRTLISGLVNNNHSVRIVSSVEVMGQEYKNSVHESVITGEAEVLVPNFLEMRRKGTAHYLVFLLGDIGYPSCENFLKSQAIRDVLQEASEKPFDVLLTGSLVYECALPFAHIMSIPRIIVSSASVLPWLEYAIGNPQQWAYVPYIYLGYTDHMSFWQRFYNSFFSLTAILHREWVYLPHLDSIASKYLGPNIPTLSSLDRELSLVLANCDPSMDYPKANQPNVIQLGGMHLNSSQTLPKDLKTFMDKSGDAGVVIFSMGSVVKESDIPKETLLHLAESFKKIPQHVIWKWNMATPPIDPMPKNIWLLKWLPQQAMLGHPKVKVFITHGGLGSSMEAVYYGIPIIGIPLFGDQDHNVMRAVRDGSGIFLEFSNLTTNSLLEAINKVLHDSRYKEAMLKRSNVLKDKFIDPVTLGVYYIEHVIHHNGVPHLRPASLDLSWYQLYLVDVFLVAMIFFSLFIVAFIKILVAFYHIISGKTLCRNNVRKNNNKKVN